VGLTGAGVGGRGAVPLQHRTGPPPGQAHQVGLSPALGEPLMREGVAELMRVQVRQAGLAAATPKHLDQTPGGQAALEPQPQPRQDRVLVPGPNTKVAIEDDRRRTPERQGASPPALAKDERDVQVEVEVDDPEAGDLAAAGAGVQQEGDQGGIAAGLEALAAAGGQQPP
jgi:hypothetical protein